MIKGEKGKLQVCMTRNCSINTRKMRIKSMISMILFFLMLVLILGLLIVSRKKENLYAGQTYYFIYTNKSKNNLSLQSEKELVKNLGGAGVLYLYKKEYYLICNVYFDKEEAEEIKTGLVNNFANSGIIEIQTKTLKNKKAIKSNDNAKRLLSFAKENLNFLYDIEMNLISGKISEGKCGAKILANKQDYENLIELQDSCDVVVQNLCSYSRLMVLQLNNFLNDFYVKNNKQSLLCEMVVNYALIFLDMWNNL